MPPPIRRGDRRDSLRPVHAGEGGERVIPRCYSTLPGTGDVYEHLEHGQGRAPERTAMLALGADLVGAALDGAGDEQHLGEKITVVVDTRNVDELASPMVARTLGELALILGIERCRLRFRARPLPQVAPRPGELLVMVRASPCRSPGETEVELLHRASFRGQGKGGALPEFTSRLTRH